MAITAAGYTVTLHVIAEITPDSLHVAAFIGIAKDSAHDGLGRRVRVEGPTPSTWTAAIQVGDTVIFERDQSDHTTKYVYAAGLPGRRP